MNIGIVEENVMLREWYEKGTLSFLYFNIYEYDRSEFNKVL